MEERGIYIADEIRFHRNRVSVCILTRSGWAGLAGISENIRRAPGERREMVG